jgi:hypothetical protein
MKTRYEQTLQDLIAFNRFHFAHSPALRFQRAANALAAWSVPIALLILFLPSIAQLAREKDREEFTIMFIALSILAGIAALISVAWVWLIRRVNAWSFDRRIGRMLREGANKAVLGPHELELTDARLIERSAYSEMATNLEAVERVVNTGEHAFIYFGSMTTYVVPRGITDGDYTGFIEAVVQATRRGESSAGALAGIDDSEKHHE